MSVEIAPARRKTARTHYCQACKRKTSKPCAICDDCRSKLPSRDRFHESRLRGRFGEEPPVPGLEGRLSRLEAAATTAMAQLAQGLEPDPLLPYPRDDSFDE